MKRAGFIKISLLVFLSAAFLRLSAQVTDSIKRMEGLESRIEKLESEVQKRRKIEFSGYIQGEVEVGQEKAILNAGRPKTENETAYTRFGIRRGRLKFAYTDNFKGIASYAVFQLDITERGVEVKDVYFGFTDPWIRWFSLQLGAFNRPFGYEISYSSSMRESPERSTGYITLFPGERDLGGKLVIGAPEGGKLAGLVLETGIFAGNGIRLDNDKKKDWISHLSYKKSYGFVGFGGGASYYLGKVYQGTDTVFIFKNKEFILLEDSKKGDFSPRTYYGLDAQFFLKTKLGHTTLRGEILAGKQPGALSETKSPGNAALPSHNTYRRNFLSWYVYFIQDFEKHSLVLKYDRYDPNTKITGNEIGLGGSGEGDIMRQNFGVGYLFRLNENIRLMAYYDMAFNEVSKNLQDYDKQLKNNILTIRLQYKF